MRKKSWFIVITVMLAVLVLAGCKLRQEAEPVPQAEQPPVSREKPAETVVAMRERPAVERDPFAPSGELPETKVLAEIRAEGRNPFERVPNVIVEPEEEPEQEPETEPEPGEEEPEPGAEPGIEPGEGTLVLQLKTLDRCWLEVLVEGERMLRTNVPKGETLAYEGNRVELQQVGRDWALDVTLNGRNLGLVSSFVDTLPRVFEFGDVQVRVSLEQRYPGGVLVGLRFEIVKQAVGG